MPDPGSYLCWIPGLRGAPCDPGFSWSPLGAETGKKTPGGEVSSFCCRFIRPSDVFGTKMGISAGVPPFCICPKLRDHAGSC